MPDNQVVQPEDLDADHVIDTVKQKIRSLSVLDGTGAPSAPPPVPEKVWVYGDTADDPISLYLWNPIGEVWSLAGGSNGVDGRSFRNPIEVAPTVPPGSDEPAAAASITITYTSPGVLSHDLVVSLFDPVQRMKIVLPASTGSYATFTYRGAPYNVAGRPPNPMVSYPVTESHPGYINMLPDIESNPFPLDFTSDPQTLFITANGQTVTIVLDGLYGDYTALLTAIATLGAAASPSLSDVDLELNNYPPAGFVSLFHSVGGLDATLAISASGGVDTTFVDLIASLTVFQGGADTTAMHGVDGLDDGTGGVYTHTGPDNESVHYRSFELVDTEQGWLSLDWMLRWAYIPATLIRNLRALGNPQNANEMTDSIERYLTPDARVVNSVDATMVSCYGGEFSGIYPDRVVVLVTTTDDAHYTLLPAADPEPGDPVTAPALWANGLTTTILRPGDDVGTGNEALVTVPGVGDFTLAPGQSMTFYADGTKWVRLDSTSISGSLELMVGTPTDPVTVGDGQMFFLVPAKLNGCSITGAQAAVPGAVSDGGDITVQLARVRAGTPADVLSTKVTIDSGQVTSYTSVAPSAVNPANDDLSVGDLLRVDVDTAGADALGLVVVIEYATG